LERIPSETTIFNFRWFLAHYELATEILVDIKLGYAFNQLRDKLQLHSNQSSLEFDLNGEA